MTKAKEVSDFHGMTVEEIFKKTNVGEKIKLVLFPFLSLEGFKLHSLIVKPLSPTVIQKNSNSRIILSEEKNDVVRIRVISESGIEEVFLSATIKEETAKERKIVDVAFMHSKISRLPLSTHYAISVSSRVIQKPEVCGNPLFAVWSR